MNAVAMQLPDAAAAARWLRARMPASGQLRTDSRAVRPGDAFIAWPGYARDGRAFVAPALAAGAAACLVESEGLSCFSSSELGCAPGDQRLAALPGLKAATGLIADDLYGAPSQALQVVASTGTNGKTSTAWWLAQALSQAGQRCGVIGTLGVGEPPTARQPDASVQPTGLTTPDPVTLHASLRRFVDEGFAAVAIEASSIGLQEHRLAGARIRVALYTNFTPDHLDFHRSMDAYWAAKRLLFNWPGLEAAVLNLDDAQGAALADELVHESTQPLQLWTYSTQHAARLRASDVGYSAGGLSFTVSEAGHDVPVRTGLIGEYNVSNVLAVLGGLRALGMTLNEAAQLAAVFTPVPGRMQRVPSDEKQPQVVVDYAHTPDALEKALQALRPFAHARGGRLWCVFGCGGNRDAAKRPVMGGIAALLADRVIVTSDNPRDEPPEAIVAQILRGCDGAAHVVIDVDRRAAVALALQDAAPEDVVLLAGKGHEDYQEVAGVKRPYSDLDEAALALQRRAAGGAGDAGPPQANGWPRGQTS
ncbi:MAG: UDP-N-acetylmuramoyl-L-alanyl-D-glutamate--2,6-diaminopimelate ligase [Burkholderiales bacterium]